MTEKKQRKKTDERKQNTAKKIDERKKKTAKENR